MPPICTARDEPGNTPLTAIRCRAPHPSSACSPATLRHVSRCRRPAPGACPALSNWGSLAQVARLVSLGGGDRTFAAPWANDGEAQEADIVAGVLAPPSPFATGPYRPSEAFFLAAAQLRQSRHCHATAAHALPFEKTCQNCSNFPWASPISNLFNFGQLTGSIKSDRFCRIFELVRRFIYRSIGIYSGHFGLLAYLVGHLLDWDKANDDISKLANSAHVIVH